MLLIIIPNGKRNYKSTVNELMQYIKPYEFIELILEEERHGQYNTSHNCSQVIYFMSGNTILHYGNESHSIKSSF